MNEGGSASSDDAARELMFAIDRVVPTIWMVRTFLKHADESEDDEDLRAIVRDLYDFILALGPVTDQTEPAAYLKSVKKKRGKLKRAAAFYTEIQPEVSGHTNFEMAARSLTAAVEDIERLMNRDGSASP